MAPPHAGRPSAGSPSTASRFGRHHTGSLACVPSRPTLFTGQYPDLHGVTQTDGLGKAADDSRMRWLPDDEVPTLGHWFRAGGYDTHYQGKWHISHADLLDPPRAGPGHQRPTTARSLRQGVGAYRGGRPAGPSASRAGSGPSRTAPAMANAGLRRDPLTADRVVAWLDGSLRPPRRAGDPEALRPFLLVASFVNPHDIVLFPVWAADEAARRRPRSTRPTVPEAPTEHEDLARQAGRPGRLPGRLPVRLRPAAAIARVYERKGAGLPATCTTGSTPRSTARSSRCAGP